MHARLPTRTRRRRFLRPTALSLASLLACAGSGCQSYEPRPLDTGGHASAFLARTPTDPGVAASATQSAMHAGRATTFDPLDGVSCPEAELLALVFNADLRLARMRAGVTRASAENAGLWEDPTIGVDLARIVQSTPDRWKVFSSLGITIPISGRLEIEKQRAAADHGAELTRLARDEWSVRMAVRRAWGAWSALDAQLIVTREFLTRIEQVLLVVEQMERSGEIARTEARLFRIERAAAALQLSDLEFQAGDLQLRLRQLMGMSPDAPLQFQSTGIVNSDSRATSDTSPTDLALQSPAMRIAQAEYDAAEKALELEVRRQYPDLQIGPGYGREDGQDQVLLGLSIPVPILNANRQRIAEARARRELAQVGVETTLEQTIAAIRAAQARLAAKSRHRQTLATDIVPLVDAQYTDAREVARLGEVNTLVLLESLQRQQQARIGLVEASRDEALAAIDLDELIGPPSTPHSTPTNTSTAPDAPGAGVTPSIGVSS